MAEHDRLPFAPILVKNIDAVPRCDDRHGFLQMAWFWQMLVDLRILYLRLYVFLMMPRRSIKPVKMMDRAVTLADTETVGSSDCSCNPRLRAAHRRLQWLAFGQSRRDRR